MNGMEVVRTSLLLLAFVELALAVSEVTYVCFTKGHNAVRLVCPKGRRIRIVEARYGRSRWGACVLAAGVGVEAQACTQQTMEYTSCCGQTTCLMPSKAVYMPACGYQSHFLRIIHDCVKDEPVVCGPSLVGLDNSKEDDEKKNLRNSKISNGSFDVVGPRDVVEITPVEILPIKNLSVIVVNMTRIKGRPDSEQDHSRPVGQKLKKHPEKYTIMGFDAVIVWSFLGVGLFIVIILSLILVLLCKHSPKRKARRNAVENRNVKNSSSANYGDKLYFDDYRASTRKCDNYINAKKETVCPAKGHINPGYYADTTGKQSTHVGKHLVQDVTHLKSSPTSSVRSECSGISLDDNEKVCRPQPSIRSNKTNTCGGGCNLNIQSYSSHKIPLNNVCADRNHKPKLKPKPVFS